MSEVKSLAVVVKEHMMAVASLQISQAMIPTPAASSMITQKMDALTALAASCPPLNINLVQVIRIL